MLTRVVTGGESGVEQAAWGAARRAGVATGGYMPHGFLTETGPVPRLGQLYGAVEFPFDAPRRIRANLRRADGFFWFGDPESPEAREAFAACRELGKPTLVIALGFTPPREVSLWLETFEISTLVVSGDRESKSPGVGGKVETFLGRVIDLLQRRAQA